MEHAVFEGSLDVVGDLEVKATGTNSLMQKEVRSQRLTMFLQTAQSPAIAPFVKISKLVSELAYSLDLDPDEILNDPEEAAIMAQIIGMQNVGRNTGEEAQPGGQQPAGMGGLGGTPVNLKTLELQALAVATSNRRCRLQGRITSLARLESLPEQVKKLLNRLED